MGGGGWGAKEEHMDEIWVGEHAWEFLFNSSKVTENAFILCKCIQMLIHIENLSMMI